MNNVAKCCVALAAGAVALSASAAWALQPNEQELQKELNALKAQVSELQARQGQDQSAVASTIEQVLRDAEKRSQMMAAGDSSAGYDNGFFIRSGEFTFKPGINFQFRNVTDYRESTSGSKDAQVENGFEIRRMQLKMGGTAFSKDLVYYFELDTDRNNGGLNLNDAWVKYMFCDAWGFRVGQWKEPFFHEKITSDTRLMAVERSLLDATLGGGWSERIQGASLLYGNYAKENPLNVELAITDGSNSRNTDYTGHYSNDPATLDQVKGPGGHAFDFGVAGRAEYKAMGDWKPYTDFSAQGVKENFLVLGAGVEWNQGGNGDEVAGTLDLSFKHTSGFALYAAGAIRHIDGELSVLGTGQTDWGAQLMVSYLMSNTWEPFVRYSYVHYDTGVAAANDENNFHEISVGVVYFLGENGSAGHRAKVTVDVNWLPNGAPMGISGLGYLGDSAGDNEIAIRGQFQLAL